MTTELKKNKVVRSPIMRVNKPHSKGQGRPKKKTVRQFHNGINSYFKWCEENDRVPSITGMMLHMKMLREAFYWYLDYPEYKDMLENARAAINEWVGNDIYGSQGQPIGKIAYAKNVLDWTERINTVNQNETTVKHVMSVEDARAKIASLIHQIDPELLKTLENKYTLNQIAQTIEVTP